MNFRGNWGGISIDIDAYVSKAAYAIDGTCELLELWWNTCWVVNSVLRNGKLMRVVNGWRVYYNGW